MVTVTGGPGGLNLTPPEDLTGVQDATGPGGSGTAFTLENIEDQTFNFTGSGFVYGGGNGRATGGTITGFSFLEAGVLQFQVTGLSMTAAAFFAFVDADNPLGLYFTWFAGNDTMTGTALVDQLYGYGGNDTLNGNGSADLLVPMAGADTVNGGNGNDSIAADGAESGDNWDGGVDTDTLLVLAGGTGDYRPGTLTSIERVSFANTFADTVAEFTIGDIALNGLITGSGFRDVITFTAESAGTYNFSTLTFAAWAATDGITIRGSDGNDDITGTTKNDTLDGDNGVGFGDDVLRGGDGNDYLDGWSGRDEVYGGNGNDTLQAWQGEILAGEILAGGAGTDSLSIVGENYLDQATVTSIEQIRFAGSAEDAESFGYNNVRFSSAQIGLGLVSSTATIFGSFGSYVDVFLIVAAADGSAIDASGFTFDSSWQVTDQVQLYGGAGANTITGSSKGDVLGGADGADTLFGGDGNDEFYAGPGGSADGDTDNMHGGFGNDAYGVFEAGDIVHELSGQGTDRIAVWIDNYTLTANVENMALYGPALTATGNGLANSIIGNAGANVLDGAGGADSMSGEGGADTYFVDNAGDQVNELEGEGTDLVNSSISFVLDDNIEKLVLTGVAAINATGNALNNTLAGNDALNVLNGLGGADKMIGYDGDDKYYVDNAGDVIVELVGNGVETVISSVNYTLSANVENLTLGGAGNLGANGNAEINRLTGNTGNNTLKGLDGADIIKGLDGNDVIYGGNGIDALLGGAGLDTFVFNVTVDAANRDTISDFNPVQDTLRLDHLFFTGIGPNGVLGADAFQVNGVAADADVRIIYNSGNGKLFFDADGSGAGAAIWFATLSPGLALTNADFVVV